MRRLLALVLPVMVLLTACGARRPEPAQPVNAPVAESQPVPESDLVRLKRLAEAQPTGDNWNELSYAYLVAGQYPEAVAAGKQALKLKTDHPYATYNTGLALLESGDPCSALSYLEQSVLQQPDRHEPEVGLARTHLAMGRYALAAHHAREAAKIKADSPEVKAVLAALDEARRQPAPADLRSASLTWTSPAGEALYLYSRPLCGNQSTYTLYIEGTKAGLSVGPLGLSKGSVAFQRQQLPGGAVGYWLDTGAPVGAGISSATAWKLFTVRGTEIGQVLFAYDAHEREESMMDYVKSAAPPTISDGQVHTSYMDGAGGITRLTFHRRLSDDLLMAVPSGHDETMEAKIVSVTGTQLQVTPLNRLGVPQEQYRQKVALAPGGEVFRNAQSVPLADLRPGERVEIAFEGDEAKQIHVLK